MWAKAVVFEIWGPYGLFRKIYSPISPVSYPCPPPPTILGIVGAIVGFGKDEYLGRLARREDDFAVAIRLMKPVRKFRAGLNLINTKDAKDFRPTLPDPRIQIPFEFLRDPHYRIFFCHRDQAITECLTEHLRAGRTVYTPCLGLAQCIANVGFIGELGLEEVHGGEVEIHSVVPTDQAEVKYIPEKQGERCRYLRLKIPSRLAPDRTPLKYQDLVIETTGKPTKVFTKSFYRCNEENILLF